jgi:hypothetical protein
MRALALAIVLLPVAASAEPFLELAGGLDVPLSDDEYTSYVDPSVTLSARIGGGGPVLGGMLSVDWTPLSADGQGISFQRFRVLGHLTARKQVAPKVEFEGRFGAGVDIIHESVDVTVLGFHVTGDDTDAGLAFEFGGGAWFTVAGSTQIGVELSVPISLHFTNGNKNNPNDPNDAKFDYTSVDLDVLGGVRLRL